MNKKVVKISLMVIIVLLIVLGSYFIFFGNPIEGLKGATSGGVFPLKKGDRGEEVRQLQEALGISADGIFGSQTEAKVLERLGTSTVSKSQFNSLV